jgi:hypothetical protein
VKTTSKEKIGIGNVQILKKNCRLEKRGKMTAEK